MVFLTKYMYDEHGYVLSADGEEHARERHFDRHVCENGDIDLIEVRPATAAEAALWRAHANKRGELRIVHHRRASSRKMLAEVAE